jgi:tRNA pseudouridine13 synthase
MTEQPHQSRAHEEAAAHRHAGSPQAIEPHLVPLPDGRGSELPYLTADLPGCGGTLKVEPEDFAVEEIPAYEPSGEGEHLFLWIEKRDVSAEDLVHHIAQVLGISRDDVGTAGLKDRRAITRQYVSVPATCADRIGDVGTGSIQVLRSMRHGNKLRTGHLRGNRFEIVLRDVGSESHLPSLGQIVQIISERGFPNYYGEQRFGAGGETLELGLDLLTGNKKPRDIPHRQRRFLLRLALSSVQSALFNEVLAERLRDGLLHTVLEGDVMQKRESGGLFFVEDVPTERERFEAGETVITGPMYGPKMRRPTGPAAQPESAVLARYSLTPGHFAAWKRLLPGTRRPLLAFASGLTIEQTECAIRMSFTLDRGVYATTLLREFMKTPVPHLEQASGGRQSPDKPVSGVEEQGMGNSE